MNLTGNRIFLTIVYTSGELLVETFRGEYRDLRCLIQDRLYSEEFGQCGGMGKCGTCLVEISELTGEAASLIRNEATTLDRLASCRPGVRLACQVPVDSSLSNLFVKILCDH